MGPPQMENESRQCMIAVKRKRKRLPAAAGTTTTSVHDLSDDLLELVLLGLDTPVCLVRAAATCKLWRRVIAGAGGAFLRRLLSLHRPRPIGTYYSINRDTPCSYGRFHLWPDVDPVFVPSPAAASPLQLSLDFVPPADCPRELVDGRGSLLLLLKEKDNTRQSDTFSCWCRDYQDDNIIPDLVVCEPLTQRYQAIPPPDYRVCILGAFLLDGDNADAMTNFRVLLVLYEHDTGDGLCGGHNGHGYPSASVFTGGGINGGWHHSPEEYDDGVYLPCLDQVDIVGRTGGCIYWAYDGNKVMVLDEHTLDFSSMALSEHMLSWNFGRNNFRVVSRGDGVVQIVHLTERGDLEVFSQSHGTGEDWEFETSIQLVEASRGLPGRREEYFATALEIIEAEEALVVLSPSKKTWLFSVDLETEELKREYRRKKYTTGPAFPYTLPWPPVMRACVEDNEEKKEEKTKEKEETFVLESHGFC